MGVLIMAMSEVTSKDGVTNNELWENKEPELSKTLGGNDKEVISTEREIKSVTKLDNNKILVTFK